MCGCLGAEHCGHEVSVVAVAFQFARRERVLEREVFRFGTATSVPFLSGVGSLLVAGRCRKVLQRRPSWIKLVVVVRRVFCQVHPTPVSYTHLRAHETDSYLVCRLLLEKKKKKKQQTIK